MAKYNNEYPNERINGHVWLGVYNSYWISDVKKSARLPRNIRRLFYGMCKHYKLNPKSVKNWWHYGGGIIVELPHHE